MATRLEGLPTATIRGSVEFNQILPERLKQNGESFILFILDL